MCTELMAVDRLGSGVWVTASFQMFALTAGGRGNVRTEVDREEDRQNGAMSRALTVDVGQGIITWGKCPGENS